MGLINFGWLVGWLVGWLSGFRAQTGSVAYWRNATFVRRLGEAVITGKRLLVYLHR